MEILGVMLVCFCRMLVFFVEKRTLGVSKQSLDMPASQFYLNDNLTIFLISSKVLSYKETNKIFVWHIFNLRATKIFAV